MKKNIITKTIDKNVFWLRIQAEGEDEKEFIEIAENFYSHTKEGHDIFIRCCLINKFASEDLKKKYNKNLFTKLHFGISKIDTFANHMKKLDEEEKKIEKIASNLYTNSTNKNGNHIKNSKTSYMGYQYNKMLDNIVEKIIYNPIFRTELLNTIENSKNCIDSKSYKKC